jgi:hypothetical protein
MAITTPTVATVISLSSPLPLTLQYLRLLPALSESGPLCQTSRAAQQLQHQHHHRRQGGGAELHTAAHFCSQPAAESSPLAAAAAQPWPRRGIMLQTAPIERQIRFSYCSQTVSKKFLQASHPSFPLVVKVDSSLPLSTAANSCLVSYSHLTPDNTYP